MRAEQSLFINNEDRTDEVRGFVEAIGLDQVAPERCSILLITQLYCECVIAQRLNPYKLLYEIEVLEGRGRTSRTKPATQFKHPPLRGLWHKHFLADGLRSMALNLRLSLKKHGLPHMERLAEAAERSGEVRYLSEEDIGAIVHDAVRGNYARRADASELTGDWLVYAHHEGRNYYLCAASHATGDETIRAWIDTSCVHEFPFLRDLLP